MLKASFFIFMKCSHSLTQTEQDVFWMQHALSLAEKAEKQGEVPVGAVLVEGTEMVAEGWNQTIQTNDPTAHAEVVAMRNAGHLRENYRLPGLTLYVTLEPCPMCAGAMVHARVERLVVGAPDPRTGAAGTVFDLTQNKLLNHRLVVEFGVLEENCSNLLKSFFRKKRAK